MSSPLPADDRSVVPAETASPSGAGRRWAWIAVALLLAAVSVSSVLDQRAEGSYQQSLQRALVTFGLARALNGVISVLQGTEVAVEPAGVGVTFTPGQLLDPLNDLVERFSWLMLVASVSLGVQQTLLAMSGWWGLRLIVTLAAVGVLAAQFSSPTSRWRTAALRFLVLAALLRLAMPLMLIANDALYQVFMREDYEAAAAIVEQTTDELSVLAEQSPQGVDPDQGWFDSMRQWFGDKAEQWNLAERVAAFQQRLAGTTEQLLRLSAVFLLQTLLLPLATLWLFAKGGRLLFRWLLPPAWHRSGATGI